MKKYTKGTSGNPKGRPKGALNKVNDSKQFKKTILGVSKEALENIIDLMRSNKALAETMLSAAEDLDEGIADAEAAGDEEKAKTLRADKLRLIERGVDAKEGAAKYAIKIVDYVYHITVHNDNLEIKRFRAQMQEEKDENDTGDDIEDQDDNDGMPYVSIVPLS